MNVKRFCLAPMVQAGMGLIGVVLMSGCAGPSVNYIHRDYKPESVGRIVVLPAMDNRARPNDKHSFEPLSLAAENRMVMTAKFIRHYHVVPSRNVGDPSLFMPDKLPSNDGRNLDSEWVKGLGPDWAEWVLVPAIDDITRSWWLIGDTSLVSMRYFLFNRRTGELFWQASFHRHLSVDGLFSILLTLVGGPQAIVFENTVLCARGITRKLPPRPRRGAVNGGKFYLAQTYSGMASLQIDRIAVFSPIDARRVVGGSFAHTVHEIKSQSEVPEHRIVQDRVIAELRKKGYSVEKRGTVDLTEEDIVSADPDTIRSWGRDGDRYVVFPVINDSMPFIGFRRREGSIFFFDTLEGTLLWEGTSWHNSGINGYTRSIPSAFPARR